MKEAFAKIHLGGIPGSMTSSMPVTQGRPTAVPYLGVDWRGPLALAAARCVGQCLSLHSCPCCSRTQEADALSFCVPDLRDPGG